MNEERKDQLAHLYYGCPYRVCCKRRKKIVDAQIRLEERSKQHRSETEPVAECARGSIANEREQATQRGAATRGEQ
jgi:hypothetical protein